MKHKSKTNLLCKDMYTRRKIKGGGEEKDLAYKVTLEMFYLRKYAKICFSEVNIIILFTEWNHILVKNIKH